MIDFQIATLYEQQYIKVAYSNDVDSKAFRNAQTVLLEMIRLNNIKLLYLDFSNISLLSPNDRVWIYTDWFPEARKAGLKLMTCLIPKSEMMKVILIKPLMEISNEFGISLQWFNNETEALDYLKQQNASIA